MNRQLNQVDFDHAIDWISQLTTLIRQDSSSLFPVDRLIIAAENLADACRTKIYKHEKEDSHE